MNLPGKEGKAAIGELVSDYSDYFAWLAEGGRIRVSARAIIFNRARNRILVEKNSGEENGFFNFIGGGVEVDETLEECIARELEEESDARVMAARYLFVVENFIWHRTERRHSLEHYFEIALEDEHVAPRTGGVAFWWIAIEELGETDLRPVAVRDSIRDGSYAQVGHMVLRNDKQDGQ